jgi:hypothetical protein
MPRARIAPPKLGKEREGRKRALRHSRDELRALMLTTGGAVLVDGGLGTGVDHITFKRVFERLAAEQGIHLTNASVIGRIWPDQAAYQSDVLLGFARQESSSQFLQTLGPLQEMIERADLSSVESRRLALQELCRVGAAANMQAIRDSPTWDTWRGVWAYAFQRAGRRAKASAGSNTRQEVRKTLLHGYEATTRRYQAIYEAAGPLLGFRLRSPYTFRQLAVAVSALAEGCGLRDQVDPGSSRHILRPTGRGGEKQEWTLFGIGVEALMNQFLEPDPDWRPPATD